MSLSSKDSIGEPPEIYFFDPVITQGSKRIFSILKKNLMNPSGKFRDTWFRPAPRFPACYLWDSAFISQVWMWWNPEIAIRGLRHFVDFQDPNGKMPHRIFMGRNVSPLSNPPFLAWSISKILDFLPISEKQKWLEFFTLPLFRFVKWRDNERKLPHIDLYYWKHSYESGIDNSPRFTSRDEKKEYGTEFLAAIDLNSEILLQLQSLLKLLEEFYDLWRPSSSEEQGEKEFFSKYGISLSYIHHLRRSIWKNMERYLWDAKAGLFFDYDLKTKSKRSIDTIASYFPLILKELDKAKVEALCSRLSSEQKYCTLIPLPTVARDSPHFEKDMWRGSVWINTAFVVLEGLKNVRKWKLLALFAYRLVKGVMYVAKNNGNFYEFYDPDRYDLKHLHRKKGNLYKALTLGTKPVKNFIGWTGLINTIILEHIMGLHLSFSYKDTQESSSPSLKISLQPHLSEELILDFYSLKKDSPSYDVGNGSDLILGVFLPFFNIKVNYFVRNNEKEQKGREKDVKLFIEVKKDNDLLFEGIVLNHETREIIYNL